MNILKPMNVPTPHQEQKAAEALQILQTSKRLVNLGSAGVGKTFLVDYIISQLKKTSLIKGRIVCAAPTHKALKVLRDKVSSPGVSFETIHSVLCYRKITDKLTGVESFAPNINEKYPPLRGVGLLILDEGSMLNLEMSVFLERYGANTIIIYVGDNKQINPVGEDESVIFWGKPVFYETEEEALQHTFENRQSQYPLSHNDEVYCPKYKDKYAGFTQYPTVELTEIIRQGAGNPIIPLSRNLHCIFDFEAKVNEDESKGFVYTTNYPKIIEELAAVNGTDELKYLAWSNPIVDALNERVRQRLYGTHPAKVEPNEVIVFDSPYRNSYNTNDELKVEKLNIDWCVFNIVTENKMNRFNTEKVPLKCYIINGIQVDEWGDGNLTWRGVFIIHEDSEKVLKSLYGRLSRNCSNKILDYETRNDFFGKFAKFKYNHALTVHKSQGSTYKNVILDVGSIVVNPNKKEMQRLLYTGVTRTSELLILYNVNNTK